MGLANGGENGVGGLEGVLDAEPVASAPAPPEPAPLPAAPAVAEHAAANQAKMKARREAAEKKLEEIKASAKQVRDQQYAERENAIATRKKNNRESESLTATEAIGEGWEGVSQLIAGGEGDAQLAPFKSLIVKLKHKK